MADRLPMNFEALGVISRRLAFAVVASFPEVKPYAQMLEGSEADGLSLYLVVPSPTHDEARALEIWVDEAWTPSIGFGIEHTHELPDENGVAEIVERARAVFEDKILIIEDASGDYKGHSSWVDLRLPNALEEELTDPNAASHVLLKSWSGRLDREIVVDDCRW